jgi:hypothetical protein
VELTEVSTRGQAWWTLGFEASGPADLLRSALEGTARLLFTHPLPGAEPGLDESGSYMQWLSQQPGHKERRRRLKTPLSAEPVLDDVPVVSIDDAGRNTSWRGCA